MGQKYNRREFIKMGTTGLVATLLSPEITLASLLNSPYPYKTPTSREDLSRIPEVHLLARAGLGEADKCIIPEQLAVLYSAINRVNDNKSYNGENSITNVLLKKYNGRHQYDCFNDTSKDPRIIKNFLRTLDPASHDPEAWQRALKLAKFVMSESISDMNKGQTSYVTKYEAKKLRKKKSSWFKNSIPIDFRPYNDDFYHDFVKDP